MAIKTTTTNTISTPTLTPAQKAWQTRRENARKAKLSERAKKAWATRRSQAQSV